MRKKKREEKYYWLSVNKHKKLSGFSSNEYLDKRNISACRQVQTGPDDDAVQMGYLMPLGRTIKKVLKGNDAQ